MKKHILAAALLLTMILFLIGVCDPHWLYSDMVPQGNLYYSMHKILNVCRVGYGEWPGQEGSFEMVIPDEVDGHRVTIWGDDYPNPFLLNMDGVSGVWPEELLPKNAVIVPRCLTINVGKNLKEIYRMEMKVFYQDENDPSVFYQLLVNVICSADNRYFYSEDGKLYRKYDDTLIDLFYYQADF